MDGLLTLIVLIIIFNLFSAVLRAIRGGGAAAGGQKPVKAFDPDSQLGRFLRAAEMNDPDDPDLKEYAAVAESEYEAEAVSDFTYRLYEPEARLELALPQEAGRTVLPEPAEPRTKTTDQVCPSVPASGIIKVLTEKDSFLAAFVLHEILDTPPALRRRRRL